jgi:hypothetical protein
VTRSARGGHFSKGLAGYNIGNVQQFLKNTCSEKKNQGRFRHVGSDHSLVSWVKSIELVTNSTEIGTSSIDCAQALPEDGDRIQSPKRRVLKNICRFLYCVESVSASFKF